MSEKNNMNQISCDMVQDLLPLYQDGLVRDKTKDAVRQHLEQCSACRHVYEQLKMPVALEKNETEQGVERFQAMVKKNREIVKNKIALVSIFNQSYFYYSVSAVCNWIYSSAIYAATAPSATAVTTCRNGLVLISPATNTPN